MASLLGCPMTGDGAVEQWSSKEERVLSVLLLGFCEGRLGAIKKKGRDKEGKK